MNDKDHLSFQADTYPGCEEDDPIAIVCGEAPVNQAKSQESEKKTTTFSKSIRVTGTWRMLINYSYLYSSDLTWMDSRRPSKLASCLDDR
jgi:hypothetical protein